MDVQMSGWEEPDLRGSGATQVTESEAEQWTWKEAARMMYFCRFNRKLALPVGSFFDDLKSLCGKQKFT